MIGWKAVALGWVGLAVMAPSAASEKIAQEPSAARYTFAGIPWDLPADTALRRLSERGYVEIPSSRDSSRIACQGKLFERWALVFGYLDDQGHVVRWVVTVAPKGDRFEYTGMRKVYDDVVEETQLKHGKRRLYFDRFRFPFEKGDGREDKALQEGYATIRSEWHAKNGDRLTVEMSRARSVVVTYETPGWQALETRRRGKRAADL